MCLIPEWILNKIFPLVCSPVLKIIDIRYPSDRLDLLLAIAAPCPRGRSRRHLFLCPCWYMQLPPLRRKVYLFLFFIPVVLPEFSKGNWPKVLLYQRMTHCLIPSFSVYSQKSGLGCSLWYKP